MELILRLILPLFMNDEMTHFSCVHQKRDGVSGRVLLEMPLTVSW